MAIADDIDVKTKAVAKKSSGEITTYDDDLMADAGGGMQGVTSDDLAIPFVNIIQSNSPQRKKSDGAYINGIDEGDIYNTVSQEYFTNADGGVIVVPCAYHFSYRHWKAREDGGGFLGQYERDDKIVSEATRDGSRRILPDGTYLADTADHYVLLVLPDGSFKRAVISMTSTQLKKSRRWMTIMAEEMLRTSSGQVFQAPTFLFKYRLTTQAEDNDKGSWFGWRIEKVGKLDYSGSESDIYQAAKAFSEAVNKGEVKVANPPADGSSNPEDEIPF